jgi:hypothetical protein
MAVGAKDGFARQFAPSNLRLALESSLMNAHHPSFSAIQLAFNLGTAVSDFMNGVFHRRLRDILFACLIANFMFLAASDAGPILLSAFSGIRHC